MKKNSSQQMRTLFVTAFALLLSVSIYAQWKTVRVGGGGATTSIQAHPLVQNLYFITTDVGTPYRWNSTTQAWEGLFYKFPPSYWNKNAAGNIAFDPQDATGNVLYATIGGPWVNGTIMKSTDRGTNWTDCQITLDVKPNNDQAMGQRLAVDPNNSNVVYVTTRPATSSTAINGLFKSTSAGVTGSWSKVNDLCGSFLVFDVSGGTVSGVTKNIYIGCADGVYRSTDGGTSFALMSGSPTNVRRAAIHSDGTLYVTHTAGVAKWNGSAWLNISPTTGNSYQAVDVNPHNSSQVIVGIASWSPYLWTQYLSSNGGTSWTKINPVKDNTEVPWFTNTIGQGLDDFCWDPFNQNMVWFSDFFDAHQTTNIWAGSNVTWKARAVGHEETVTIGNLLCPPSGVNQLLSNVADIGGWDHKSISTSPSVGMVSFFPWTPSGDAGNMTGVAIEETNPNFIARVGRHGWSGAGYAGYSTDGGSTYTLWTCPSDAAGGRIAVSATTEAMVWTTQSGPCYYSNNRGTTWTAISTLPTGVIGGGANVFNSGPAYPLAADKVNGNKFYVYNAGSMYVSTDGGNTFAKAATNLPNVWYSNPLVVETTPGKEGDIWLSMHDAGLYHSTNSGASFTKLSNVQLADFVSCGKASSTTPTIPALYVYGTVNNIANGLFRSNDNGATWETVSAPIQTGYSPNYIVADRQTYGRVIFGTNGNGMLCFESPSTSDTIAPTTPTSLTSSNITGSSFTLNWTASTDNVGVTGYEVFTNGVSIGTTTATTLSVTNLSCGTNYSMTVRARDAAGNWSAQSTALNVLTSSCPDTQAPSVPTGLASSSVAQTSFTLNWTASTDNVGVTGYEVFKNGVSIGTTTATMLSVSGLTANTTYGMTVRARDAAGNWSPQSAALNVTTTTATSPAPIPGTIQAENYSNMYGLIIGGTPLAVGYVDPGDWIEYNVNIAATGNYAMTFHAASAYNSGSCYVTVDGGSSLGSFTCPNTGGWSTYKDFTINVILPAGLHTLRLNYTNAAFNNDYMVFVKAAPIPGTIQAEDYSNMYGLIIGGTPLAVGYVDPGDWIEYSVNIATTDNYTMTFRAASAYNSGSCYVTVDGGASLGTFTCPNTGGWSTYNNYPITVALPAGLHTLRLNYTNAAFNNDYMVFANSTPAKVKNVISSVGTRNDQNLMIYPSPVLDILHLKGIGNFTKINIYNGLGQLFSAFNIDNTDYLDINMSKYERGIYMIQFINSVDSKTKVIIKK